MGDIAMRRKIPETSRSCQDCGKPLSNPRQKPRRCRKCYASYQNSLQDKHWNYRGGKYINSEGYVLTSAKNHPFCQKGGVVLEHRLVMEQKLGRYLSADEVVHHINGIKNDNNIENLVLCKSPKVHKAFHLKNNGKCRLCDEKHRSKGLCRRHYKRLLYFLNKGEPISFDDSTEKLKAILDVQMPWYDPRSKDRFSAYK